MSTPRIDFYTASPAALKAMLTLEGSIAKLGLEASLIELVKMRTSQINGCAFCLDMHTRELLSKGEPVEKLALLQAWREAGTMFDARERAALAWAESVTRVAETGVPDEHYAAAREIFSERELVDLTFAIGLMNTYNRMAISFRSTPKAVLDLAHGC